MEKRIENKHRPSLGQHKTRTLLFRIHTYDQFQKVCVAPDKMEHEKHKRLVTELKKRRSEGESVLIIENGAIIVRSSKKKS